MSENDPLAPVPLDTAKKKAFCALIADGYSDNDAAANCRIPVAEFRKARKADPWFNDEWAASSALAIGAMERALRDKGLSGDTPAMRFYLTNRDPDNWRERISHDVSGRHTVVHEFAGATAEGLRSLGRQAIIDAVEVLEDDKLGTGDEQRALPPVQLARHPARLPRQPGAADGAQHGSEASPPPDPGE